MCYLFKILTHGSMKPAKLKLHLSRLHPEAAKKYVDYFKAKATCQKKKKKCQIWHWGITRQQNKNVEASYEISLQIAGNKKPQTIGETMIKPCIMSIVRLLFGEASCARVRQISISNNTVKSRICDMSANIFDQVLSKMKQSILFLNQLDESADVASCSHHLIFASY